MFPEYTNWFDPEERKRRMLLAPSVSPEEVPDQQAEVPASNTASMTPTLSPAQARYKAALDNVPNSGDYKPSKMRRLAAAISGGFAGASGGPLAGMHAAQSLIDAPYQAAVEKWQGNVGAAAGQAGIEEKAMAEEVARRRAAAYEQSANARTRAAAATEQRVNWQMSQPQKWQPTTKEDAFAFEEAQHPKPAPTWTDPNYVEGYIKGHPQRAVTDQMALERLRQSGQAAHDARVASLRRELAKNRSIGVPASARQQGEADSLAAERLARTNSDYAAFVVPGDPTKRIPTRPKRMDELPTAGGGFLGMGGISESQVSLTREKYRQFLSELAKEREAILGSKNPQGQQDEDDEFDIQQLMEDDEEDQ